MLRAAPTAATRVAAVIGDPVRHSLSPVLHNAAFAALGVDWVYVALPVRAGSGGEAVAAMRTLGLAGLSVTMPHKAAAAAAVDVLSSTASRLDAVNTVVRRGDALHGDSTDGDGFVDALRSDEGFEPAGRRCVVLGAGGAARAVTMALAEHGAEEVVVIGRRPDKVASCAALAGPAGRGGEIHEVDQADLIVNATPVGMTGGGLPFSVEPARLGPGQLVIDLVYRPARTPLLVAARQRGAAAANGLGMLIHQAARQVTIWTGQEPPLAAMSAAVLASLGNPDD
ncbi:MAG: shikimate dehydrogenase [Acidimicrobiales bacterium]